MNKFNQIIDYYAVHWWSSFSKLTPETNWGNKKIAQSYLEKYWLSKEDYLNIWKPIQNRIFIEKTQGLPELIFRESFHLLALSGGCLFTERDFLNIQKCILKIGGKNLVVIENDFGKESQEPLLTFVFPSDITWIELTSGNYMSSLLLESNYKEFFVFSENGLWGKYAANDYEYPFDIVGYHPDYSLIFKNNLSSLYSSEDQVKTWLPTIYRQVIRN